MTTRLCPECGAEFMPRHGSQVCCSDKCRMARLRRRGVAMTTRLCHECGAEFMPRSGAQVCCSDKCRAARHRRIDKECRRRARGSKDKRVSERVQRMILAAERKEKARRRAKFFAARDAAFEKAGLPIPKIEERGGVRIERRGTCVGVAGFNPTIPISPKSYYYR